MAAPADISQSSTNTNTAPITLPEALEGIQLAIRALTTIEAPLAERIEANRRRSERNRRNGAKPEANGHGGDLAVQLTRHGVMLVCRHCGKAVAS